jgi:hypothetical protein
MDKAAGLGLAFRDQVAIDVSQVAPPIIDSYREFAYGLYRFVALPFYRPIGLAPEEGRRRRPRASTKQSTARCSIAGGPTPPTVRRTWRRGRR